MPTEKDSVLYQHFKGFVAGALAGCGAVTFTNPWEVAKVRLQLQGELQLKSNAPPKPYGSAITTFVKIYKNEGIVGLQRGLAPAYIYQILLNGSRLGFYDPIKSIFQSGIDYFTGTPNSLPLLSMVSSGATAGIVGLWRGVDASMLRTGVGSSVQLPSYEIIKSYLLSTGYFSGNGSTYLHFAASLGTSFMVCLAMNPFDVAMTRMYNQKDGKTYNSVFDCIGKTLRYEGPLAFFKGFTAHYLRIGPHTILTFVFLEQSRKLMSYF
ncbi:Mitochondrial oxaloacetate carrier protein [Boothiomyces macroporosus]|uniref:Mitochondrial oxaloacetate carrier protein n=1 Tax=Boothiomyces macroporosus TaxID=261099 RepID=A0AAD5UQY6_9FUNG|nr:Mitochondrial oxaloacetate carrier protein [Boothiomyces macroporosus]